jgi:hypothetical protein
VSAVIAYDLSGCACCRCDCEDNFFDSMTRPATLTGSVWARQTSSPGDDCPCGGTEAAPSPPTGVTTFTLTYYALEAGMPVAPPPGPGNWNDAYWGSYTACDGTTVYVVFACDPTSYTQSLATGPTIALYHTGVPFASYYLGPTNMIQAKPCTPFLADLLLTAFLDPFGTPCDLHLRVEE